jgi:hypothetical protein
MSRKKSRDNFSAPSKRLLAERVGHHCSEPSCRRLTSGPEKNNGTSVNMGVAAHITAAAVGGKRYDSLLTTQDRKSYNNGIWLCYSCSVLIDKSENAYSVELLQQWKKNAEKAARDGLQNPGLFAVGPSNANTNGFVLRYLKSSKIFDNVYKPPPKGFTYRLSQQIIPLGPVTPVGEHFLPLDFSNRVGRTPACCFFTLNLQNNGTGMEPYASIKIRMREAVIYKVDAGQSIERVTILNPLIEGGSTTGTTGFTVNNLQPRESLSVKIFSLSSVPFDVEMYSQAMGMKSIPNVADVVFGDIELVKSPPTNTKFEKEQYPFGQ